MSDTGSIIRHHLSVGHATLFLLKIKQFWNNLRCRKFHIISYCLAWVERYANIIGNLSNRDSMIIQNHFLHCVNVFICCWRYRATRTSRLYRNWTCVLLIVDSPNATVHISNVHAHLILFLTQNLIQFLWSNSIKSKSTPKHD